MNKQTDNWNFIDILPELITGYRTTEWCKDSEKKVTIQYNISRMNTKRN